MVTAEHPSRPDDHNSELVASFSEAARALFSAGSAVDTLRAVADLAVETIDGCDFASIFVLDGGQVITPSGTDPVVAEVDVAQHRAGEGPRSSILQLAQRERLHPRLDGGGLGVPVGTRLWWRSADALPATYVAVAGWRTGPGPGRPSPPGT
jgi:hypothetical protein